MDPITPSRARIIFITGTDTGVGKTLLTALLLAHLRAGGVKALALKPFCSGSRADVNLLRGLQDDGLSADEINPFHFHEPVAPAVAARRHRRSIALPDVIEPIESAARRCDCLLVEGAGGLLVPLGKDYSVLDLIVRLQCEVIVVSRNKLGTINHTLLTVRALQNAGIQNSCRTSSLRTPHVSPLSAAKSRSIGTLRTPHSALRPGIGVVLMNARARDFSSASNTGVLTELLAPTPLVSVPFLGANCGTISAVKKNAKKLKKTLARILG